MRRGGTRAALLVNLPVSTARKMCPTAVDIWRGMCYSFIKDPHICGI